MTTEFSPKLTTNTVKYFYSNQLKKCKIRKNNLINNIVNISLFIFIIVGISVTLYVRYKGNKTPQEIKQQTLKEEHELSNYIGKITDKAFKQKEEEMLNVKNPFTSDYEILHDNYFRV